MVNAVTYVREESLITSQNKAEKSFLEKFRKDKPSLENATVLVNPYFINPLCALILFMTDKPCSVTLTVHGKKFERHNIVKTFEKNETEHAIPVLGLYEGMDTKVTVALSTGESRDFLIRGQELPADVCRCRNIMTSFDYFGTNWMFLSPAGKNLPMGYDFEGNICWLLTVNTMFDIKRLKNGNILTGSHRFCHMPYNDTGLIELSLMGKIYKEYRMPGNYHHDMVEMPDGNILALSQDFHTDTVEDLVVLLDRETGMTLRTWDLKNILPQKGPGSGSQSPRDWFHCNAVWYFEEDKSITVSGRHEDAIVNFDYESGKLNWIIGDPENWPAEYQKYFFKPVGDDFDWQYEQHACLRTPDGDVMCFDNGHYRSKNKEKYLKNRDNFSRGVRYHIDTKKMEIRQVWQYGKELGATFFSPYISNVEYYGEGHYLIHSGGIGWEDGYASEKLGAYINPAKNPNSDICAKTVEQKDGVVLYAMEVDGNFYRAEKLQPYHDGENLVFGDGKVIGELEVTDTFDTIPDLPETDELVDSWHQVRIEEDDDRIVFHGRSERGSLVMLLLKNEKETRGYFINTAAVSYLAMCSGAYLEEDDRVIKLHVSKRGLKGTYEVRVLINDKKYATGVSINCD